jgi:hypothetical protein
MKAAVRGILAVALTAAVAVPAAIWAYPKVGALAAHTVALPAPTRTDIVLVPHPGDEFQALSLVQDDPSSYKVFVLLTHGEESKGGGLDALVERLGHHGRVDESLPSDLEPLGTRGPFLDETNVVCSTAGEADDCTAVRTAEVWAGDRGALVAFDLGDGDLTRREVAWAYRTVKFNREQLGLEPGPVIGSLVGAAFANRAYDCVPFDDPDHRVVHEVLYEIDFGVERQVAPTCADDPDATISRVVADAHVDVAFPAANDGRATTRVHGTFPTVDEEGQRRVFHTHQEFWERYGD